MDAWARAVEERRVKQGFVSPVLSIFMKHDAIFSVLFEQVCVTDELLKILSCKELGVLNPMIVANYLQLPND